MEKDDSINENMKNAHDYPDIYNNLAKGDSGGPISTKVYDTGLNYVPFDNSQTGEFAGEKRHVIVAVSSLATGIEKLSSDEGPLSTKCISLGSKVTKDVIDWIKDLHNREHHSSKKTTLNLVSP